MKNPNIVVVMADDLGWGDLGCYGHPFMKTPNLDQLATEGLRLTNCHSGSPICSPSRAGLLTGREPARCGLYGLAGPSMYMRPEEITIPALLGTRGYSSYFLGKWHLGHFTHAGVPNPHSFGFDHWFATEANPMPSTKDPSMFYEDGEAVGQVDGWYCDIAVERAVRWLDDRDESSPFYLQICTSEPHSPVTPPESFAEVYDDEEIHRLEPLVERGDIPIPPWSVGRPELSRYYYGIVSQLDAAVGRLMSELDRLDLTDNTLVFFTSDNGPEYMQYPQWKSHDARHYGSPGPFRGAKRFLYEGGIRVPGILRWPETIEAGTVSDQLFSTFDLLPTLCELTGAEPPTDRILDGTSALPMFSGDDFDRTRPLIWHHIRVDIPQAAMRIGDEVLVAYMKDPLADQGNREWLRTTEFKSIEYYDLGVDLRQRADLSRHRPDRYAQLRETFEFLWKELQHDMITWEGVPDTQEPQMARLDWDDSIWHYNAGRWPVGQIAN